MGVVGWLALFYDIAVCLFSCWLLGYVFVHGIWMDTVFLLLVFMVDVFVYGCIQRQNGAAEPFLCATIELRTGSSRWYLWFAFRFFTVIPASLQSSSTVDVFAEGFGVTIVSFTWLLSLDVTKGY